MARRWRSPPDSVWPRSPMMKSQPPGFRVLTGEDVKTEAAG